jgi:hypothetical protein
MKRLITLLFVCLCCSVFGAKAQNHTPDGALLKDILRTVVDAPDAKADPAVMEYLDAIYNQMMSSKPRYKMYKTTHDYISLKLDTATGRVWMIQIGMGDKSSRRQIAVDDSTPLADDEMPINGRFELYPTNNSYNFIMIDTYVGTTYQVQWHTESNKRFRKFIH